MIFQLCETIFEEGDFLFIGLYSDQINDRS